ncbi:uncharacterized protein LOC133796905 [Humulus lupulus]|uniref:uncharacterized protein LOC133796905 n=1 Tax=Humulus lupulus TaxID=3486 RepID=UPI002B4098F4|nr:uncharacterized protein LOC133796905 [Humulus lupulus]
MGFFFFTKSWYIILVISLSQSLVVKTTAAAAASSSLTSSSHSPIYYDTKSLTAFFHDYAKKTVLRATTGVNYKIRLPANFTGMQLRFVRFRTPSLRHRGGQFGSFSVPPRVLSSFPMDVRRLAIVYENLGNWSYSYYKVPNYTLVAPVIGFTVYNSPASIHGGPLIGNDRINISIQPGKKPIVIKFKKIDRELSESPLRCVKFSEDGSYEIESMSVPNQCFATSQGHFSVIISSSTPPPPPPSKSRQKDYLKWWLTGFGGGFAGVILVVLVSTVVFKIVRDRRIRAMEKQSECGVSFDTFSVGKSKMPSAPMVRTQPVIEHDYVA